MGVANQSPLHWDVLRVPPNVAGSVTQLDLEAQLTARAMDVERLCLVDVLTLDVQPRSVHVALGHTDCARPAQDS
jgi:hypothetical protein